MPSLSVVMIVKNESRCLATCLNSVYDIADEIVIGDTGSTDATREVAAQFGANIFYVPWRDDFAAARNAVLEVAAGNWLLHLDADEALDATGAQQIRSLVDKDGSGADAIEVTLANYCDDPRAWRWTACAPDDPAANGYSGYIKVGLLRLFRNHRGYQYREPVHENISESVRERGGVIRSEPILIHHYGYNPPQAAADTKRRFYLEIGRKKVAQRPHDPKAWHDLAEQLLACGAADEAEGACRKALALLPGDIAATTTLANLLLNRGDLEPARKLLAAVEAVGPVPPHISTALGAIAIRQGRFADARRRLEAALTADPAGVMAALYLARALELLGDIRGATELLRRLRDAVPRLSEVSDRLAAQQRRLEAEKLIEAGQTRTALVALVEALRLDNEDPLVYAALGAASKALGERQRAEQYLRRATYLAPGIAAAEGYR